MLIDSLMIDSSNSNEILFQFRKTKNRIQKNNKEKKNNKKNNIKQFSSITFEIWKIINKQSTK